MIYVIIADGTVDQICETEEQKNNEIKDLRRMGHKVRTEKFNTWEQAQAYADKH